MHPCNNLERLPEKQITRTRYCLLLESKGKKPMTQWNIGKPRSESTRKKISEKQKGIPKSDEMKKKIRETLLKRSIKPSLETRKKGNETLKLLWADPNFRKKMYDIQSGANHHLYGKHPSEEARIKMSIAHSGERSIHWKGGISFEPYCVKFNREFKERVRFFFGHICGCCGNPQNGEKLNVHHINFNKQSCCDNSTPLFIPLCRSCHGKSGHNRPYWEQHFTDIINNYYGGKCYFTKDEMKSFQQGVLA